MPRRVGLGGPGTLIIPDADPMEVALRRAELEEKLQRPATERAQLALAQYEAQQRGATAAGQLDVSRQNLALERQKAFDALGIDKAKLLEEQTRTRDTRAHQQGSLAEETRYHTGTLAEQVEGRKSTAASAREATRAGVLRDIMATYAGSEAAGTVPAGTIGGTAAELGFPELSKAWGEAAGRKTLQQAKAMLPEYQKYTPEQRKTELAAQPEEFQSAMAKLLAQPAEPAAAGAAPTATPTPAATPKPPPSATTIPIAQTSGLSFNNRPIPISLGFSANAPTPTPPPAATPPPAVGPPLTELLLKRKRRQRPA